MSHENEKVLENADLTDGLFEMDAQEVLADFGGQTFSSLYMLLAKNCNSMDVMFSYSIISKRGFSYFLPSINAYARSEESKMDYGLPGTFAHAIQNQIRINPTAVYEVQDQVESLSQYFLDYLVKFDQGDEWAQQTGEELGTILSILRRKKSAEQDAPSDGDTHPV